MSSAGIDSVVRVGIVVLSITTQHRAWLNIHDSPPTQPQYSSPNHLLTVILRTA